MNELIEKTNKLVMAVFANSWSYPNLTETKDSYPLPEIYISQKVICLNVLYVKYCYPGVWVFSCLPKAAIRLLCFL